MNHLLVSCNLDPSGNGNRQLSAAITAIAAKYVHSGSAKFHVMTPYSARTVSAVLSTVLDATDSAEVSLIDETVTVNCRLDWLNGALAGNGASGLEVQIAKARFQQFLKRIGDWVPRTVL